MNLSWILRLSGQIRRHKISIEEKKRAIARLFDFTSSIYRIHVPKTTVERGLEHRLVITRKGWTMYQSAKRLEGAGTEKVSHQDTSYK